MFQLPQIHVLTRLAIHVLLMHGFGALNTLIRGHNILRQLIRLSLVYDLVLEHEY